MDYKHKNILASLKRTKILATIGPASADPAILEALIAAGANGLRLNMSHGVQREHAAVIKLARRISRKLGKPVAIVADLQGPKIRVGQLPAEGLLLAAGDSVRFSHGEDYETGGPIPVQYDISRHMKAGQPMFLRDGAIAVQVTKVTRGVVHTTVVNPGHLGSRQGINLPETDLAGDILTPKDLDDLVWAAKQDVDYVALSFVQSAHDISGLQARLRKHGSTARVIAKIETRAAAENMEEIIQVADAVMVARGDLATETSPESVPILQEKIICFAHAHQKLAIVATQMLESMINSPQPTRAEVSDVATAVHQGADAVMLSGESAVGKYPVQAVALMKRVILYTEQNRTDSLQVSDFGAVDHCTAIAAAAITLAKQTGARLILAETTSGQTPRNLCSLRPDVTIVAVTDQARVYQQVALLWGVRAYLIRNPSTATQTTMRILAKEHNVIPGDLIIRAAGRRPGIVGGTDTIQIEKVERG